MPGSHLIACDSSNAERDAEIRGTVTRTFRTHPDFPRAGINFVDIFPLLGNPAASKTLITRLEALVRNDAALRDVSVIIGLESRGFIFGAVLADHLGIGFCPVRKAGKLPGLTVKCGYTLEYGTNNFEMQTDHGFPAGTRAIIIDDLLATGGSLGAAHTLATQVGFSVAAFLVIVELVELAATDKLPKDVPVYSFWKV